MALGHSYEVCVCPGRRNMTQEPVQMQGLALRSRGDSDSTACHFFIALREARITCWPHILPEISGSRCPTILYLHSGTHIETTPLNSSLNTSHLNTSAPYVVVTQHVQQQGTGTISCIPQRPVGAGGPTLMAGRPQASPVHPSDPTASGGVSCLLC